MGKPNVQVIPAKKKRDGGALPLKPVEKRKVAAYARVSTDSEEQLNSYEAQVSYYTDYIQNRIDWEFAGMYTDEGITAVNTKHRDGFNRMVADALDIKRHEKATERLKELDKQKADAINKCRTIRRFVTKIRSGADVLTEWDEDLWAATIDHVTVNVDGTMTFCFKNGTEITE